MPVTARLHASNIRMASDYHQDGIFGFCCHDLLQFGATGAAIAATRGRYVWIFSPDHPSGGDGLELTGAWAGGTDFLIGYSDNPGTPPKAMRTMVPARYLSSDPRDVANQYIYYHFNDLVYNPDDPDGKVFYLYCEGYVFSGPTPTNNHECGVMRSSDLVEWVGYGASHPTSGYSTTAFQRVKRLGENDWISIGSAGFAPDLPVRRAQCLWESSDPLGPFTTDGVPLNRLIGDRNFSDVLGGPFTIDVDGQDYGLFHEDARGADGGMHVTLAPVDENYEIIDTGTPPAIRLASYEGNFPSFDFLQSVGHHVADGILHFWAHRGYFSDETNPAEGQHEQAYDYYTAILGDAGAIAAADAAPVGVRAECIKGAVVLSWYDALPNKTYRVYRSTDGSTWGSAIADVTGLHYVDPLGGIDALRYYKVVTLNGASEEGESVVSTYVSNGRALTNEHVTRVLAAGGTDIDVGWLDRVATWLRDNALTDRVQFWADPSFGVIKDGSNVIDTVFCLGSTIHPRGGDYHVKPGSTSTTYNATGLNGEVPAWVNGTSSAHGYFGDTRLNPIRRKVEATFCAVYQKSHTNTITLLATSEFEGIRLQHASGSPGSVAFNMQRDTSGSANDYNVTASVTPSSATGAHIAIATFDGVTQTVYVDGVAGTPATGVLDTYLLDGQRPDRAANTNFLGSGSANVKHVENTDAAFATSGYAFNDNQAQFSAAALIVFDIALTAALEASLKALWSDRLSGSSYNLPDYDTPFVKDIVDDYSATGDRVADDAPAFMDFNAAVRTWQDTNEGLVVLKVPVGEFFFETNAGNLNSFTAGIKHLLLIGQTRETSILTDMDEGGAAQGFFLGNGGSGHLHFDNEHSARIQSVSAAATEFDLVNPSDNSILSVGQDVLLTEGDLQGFGDPPNPGKFEWGVVASIDSGNIGLEGALANGYLSTLPLFNPGDASHSDLGGPATVYAVIDGWNCEHEYRHIGMDQPDVQTKAPGRFITYTNCSASGAGIFPTENFHWIADDVLQTEVGVEIDKIIGVATIKGGQYDSIAFQSSSPDRFELMRGAIVGHMNSTPRSAYFDGFYTIGEQRFGPSAYGCAEKAILMNGSIGSVAVGGVAEAGIIGLGYTMSGGVIRVSKDHGPVQWANPDSRPRWIGNSVNSVNSLGIVGVTESGGDVLIQTDEAGGFPNVTSLGVRTHLPNFTMRGVADLITAGTVADGQPFGPCRSWSRSRPFAPLYSRAYWRFDATNINNALPQRLEGKISRITVAIPTAYTGGTDPLLLNLLGQFGGSVTHPDGSKTLWNPRLDLREARTLVITSDGVTGDAGDDADLTPPTDPLWISDVMTPYLATDISEDEAGPIVVVTFELDQSPLDMSPVARVFVCHFAAA